MFNFNIIQCFFHCLKYINNSRFNNLKTTHANVYKK